MDRQTIDAARLLSRAAVFSGVSASCLAELAGQAVTRYLEAGDHLFREGELGTTHVRAGRGSGAALRDRARRRADRRWPCCRPSRPSGSCRCSTAAPARRRPSRSSASTVVGAGRLRPYGAPTGPTPTWPSACCAASPRSSARPPISARRWCSTIWRRGWRGWLLAEAERHDDGRAYVPANGERRHAVAADDRWFGGGGAPDPAQLRARRPHPPRRSRLPIVDVGALVGPRPRHRSDRADRSIGRVSRDAGGALVEQRGHGFPVRLAGGGLHDLAHEVPGQLAPGLCVALDEPLPLGGEGGEHAVDDARRGRRRPWRRSPALRRASAGSASPPAATRSASTVFGLGGRELAPASRGR